MAAALQSVSSEWLIRLLLYIGGIATTIVGSWVSSKIHVYHDSRKAHLEDIKSNVLLPIRKELEEFEPFVFNRQPLFSLAHTTTKYHENAPLTESSVEAERMLSAAFPTGWLFRGTEPALTQDVRTTHLPEVMEAVSKFVKNWALYTGECQFRLSRLAKEILERSGLPQFPNKDATGWPQPLVMHLDLAVLIHTRSFGFPTSALKLQHMSGSDLWTLQSDDGTGYAFGLEEQVKILLDNLNALLISENATGQELLNQNLNIQEEFVRVRGLLDSAIASHRLRKKCDLVSFF
jgi:hypothetical protein